MKGSILKAHSKKKSLVINTVYHFLILTWGLEYPQKNRLTEKECIEIEDRDISDSARLYWDFEKI